MSKSAIMGAVALSLAFAVATPAFAASFREGAGSGAMRSGSVELHDAQNSVGAPGSPSAQAYCSQRWPYYDPTTGKYLQDDGVWHSCP
jgi:BA14K-like protein